MTTIEDHIKTAQYMMRGTAQLLDDYDEHNEQGRRYLLESALHNANQIYQHLFAANTNDTPITFSTKLNNKTAEEAGEEHACGGPQEACCIPGCLECGAKKTDTNAKEAGVKDDPFWDWL